MLVARREGIEWVHAEGVYEIVPMPDCVDAGQKMLDHIWVDTDKSVDPAHKKIRSRNMCQGKQDEEARQDSKSITSFSVILSRATS